MKSKCGNCEHWCSFDQVYEDPIEPEDTGFCYVDTKPGIGPEPTSEDYLCDKWKLHEALENSK